MYIAPGIGYVRSNRSSTIIQPYFVTRYSVQVVPYFLQEIHAAHLVYGAAAFVVCPTATPACSSEPLEHWSRFPFDFSSVL